MYGMYGMYDMCDTYDMCDMYDMLACHSYSTKQTASLLAFPEPPQPSVPPDAPVGTHKELGCGLVCRVPALVGMKPWVPSLAPNKAQAWGTPAILEPERRGKRVRSLGSSLVT